MMPEVRIVRVETKFGSAIWSSFGNDNAAEEWTEFVSEANNLVYNKTFTLELGSLPATENESKIENSLNKIEEDFPYHRSLKIHKISGTWADIQFDPIPNTEILLEQIK